MITSLNAATGKLPAEQLGFVVIGRNEGERLVACLQSLGPRVNRAAYVDSGSTDGSVGMARNMGAKVIELSTDVPFTAARARNAGVEALLKAYPSTTLIQFLDGDCSLRDGWVEVAVDFLAMRENVAVVCARRRERYPDRSIYNALCDREWDGPTGSITECGGDFMVRVDRFLTAGGFRPSLIAGEEPELCVRLREAGLEIWRLQREMTWHDANITRFAQWWRRQLRAGHAFAEVAWLHRRSPAGIWRGQFRRAAFWGMVLPLSIAVLSIFLDWRFVALVLVYPLNVLRIAMRGGLGRKDSWWAALFLVLGKFPETMGGFKFFLRRVTGKDMTIIEYK